jgi:hypothetical protein
MDRYKEMVLDLIGNNEVTEKYIYDEGQKKRVALFMLLRAVNELVDEKTIERTGITRKLRRI